MKHVTNEFTFSAYFMRGLIGFAEECGADIGTILREAECDMGRLYDEQSRFPVMTLNRLWMGIASQIHDPFLGLHFGYYFGRHTEGHFLMTLMKNSDTLEKALLLLIRYHNLMTDVITLHLSVRNDKAMLEWEYRAEGLQITYHVAEAVMGLLATVLRSVTNDELQFSDVRFSHCRQQESDEYVKIFTAQPHFESGNNMLVFQADELGRVFPMAHREFASYLIHYAETIETRFYEHARYRDKAALILKQRILKGEDCGIVSLADNFTMSPRSLQNRFKNEGVTFRALLDEVKKEIALHYLRQKDVMLCDIAFLLGFSEQSSFNHSFKKWTGMTPGEFRNSDGVLSRHISPQKKSQ